MLQLLILCYIALVKCENAFVYPVPLSTEVPNKSNREPLYAPSVCPKNHLLYPGNQQTDWICDCAPGFVYYPKEDGCFAVYREGPCKKGEYLILHDGELMPKCETNPCNTDGVVKYKGLCHPLEKPGGPCQRNNETEPVKILTVVKSTLKLQCVSSVNALSLIGAPHFCPPGSRRTNSNDCRTILTDH